MRCMYIAICTSYDIYINIYVFHIYGVYIKIEEMSFDNNVKRSIDSNTSLVQFKIKSLLLPYY